MNISFKSGAIPDTARSPANGMYETRSDQACPCIWMDDQRRSMDEFTSYGGTPCGGGAGPATPRSTPTEGMEGPRKSLSLLFKGLGLQKTSGRLSDADELLSPETLGMSAGFYDEIRRSNASPLNVPFSLATSFQIPEGDVYYRDAGDPVAKAPPPTDDDYLDECMDLEMGKDVNPPESIYLQEQFVSAKRLPRIHQR